MKIRSSFVANSSSSSFIVVYKEQPNIYEIFQTGIIPDELKGKLTANTYYSLSDGYDSITLTEEIIHAFNVNRADINLKEEDFVYVVANINEQGIIAPEYIGCQMLSVDVDYYSTGTDVELFIKRYVRD
jgi:hypothetical protein